MKKLVLVLVSMVVLAAAVLAAPEECNYLDDDGNGACSLDPSLECTDDFVCALSDKGYCILSDEDWPELNTECTVGLGECEAAGYYICSGDHLGTTCDATPGTPTEEICDGLDNDCDGIVDNSEICYDSDGDGVPNADDLCPDTNLDNGDQVIHLGCSCHDILDLKPGNDTYDNRHGCSKGILNVFINAKGWAKDLFGN